MDVNDDSWDLLHQTIEKVNDCLGDYWMGEIEGARPREELPGLVTRDSEASEAISEAISEARDLVLEPELWPPQPRARSNTWPRRQFGGSHVSGHAAAARDTGQELLPLVCEEGGPGEGPGPAVSPRPRTRHHVSVEVAPMPRKNSRRNPWGNCSYSDLIEQAILSSPDKRLTLNQIYDWLISNVVYFTERQDSAASSGWKNSIRHNLSLHQRFLKLPHEDAGKSSWWSLNPEPRSAAAPKQRRRATYGESRERMKKRAEAAVRSRGSKLLKSSSSSLHPLSPYQETSSLATSASSLYTGLASPFRNRSSSSASSCEDISCSMSLFSSEDQLRSRSYSNASSASQSSVAQLSELSVGHFQNINDDLSTDLEGINIEDLSLGCDFMREYLSPAAEEPGAAPPDTEEEPASQLQSVTILEPRDTEMVCQTVAVMNSMYESLHRSVFQHADLRRRGMIERELSQLIRERVQFRRVKPQLDNQESGGGEFDLKIRLLQEELDKYQVEGRDNYQTSASSATPLINTQFAV